jgi:putative transcriptional regulator
MTRALLLALVLFAAAPLRAQDLSQPMILVATPELVDSIYSRTVLVVSPLGGGEHIGFIVNRPTELTLGKIFPEDAASQKVREPVYLGGPVRPELIFALVERATSPGGKSLPVMPGLYAAIEQKTVDKIIRDQPSDARFFAGFVAWQPGELSDELKNGAWYVLAPDAHLVLDNPAPGLWQELVRRSQMSANAI